MHRIEKMRMRARLAQVVQELMDERPNLSHGSDAFAQEVQRRYEQRHGSLSPTMLTLLLAALKILLLAL